MTYVKWKIQRTPFVRNAWDVTQTVTLASYYNPLLDVSLGDTRDSFNFKVNNTFGSFDNYFQPNDKITISRVVNTETFSASDIKMVGTITDAPEESSSTTEHITLEGFNFTEAVLGALVFIDATLLTIPQAIQQALLHVQAYNANFAVIWDSGNPTTTSTGASFPVVGERFYNKPLRDLIQKYSTNIATGDGKYYWYVDNSNHFIWRRESSTTTDTFDSENDVYKKFTTGKDVKDVKNYAIVKGGLDPEGKPIQDRYLDLISIAKHSQKYQLIPDITGNAGTLHKQDCDMEGVSHMRDASYPLTTTWKSVVTGDYVTCNSYNTTSPNYLDSLREHIKARCRIEAQSYVELHKYGVLKVTIVTTPAQYSWGLGDLIVVTSTKIGATLRPLRIQSIQWATTTDTYTLAEDVGSV